MGEKIPKDEIGLLWLVPIIPGPDMASAAPRISQESSSIASLANILMV